MANQLQSVIGFVAVALLVSAASAQIFARDGAALPEPPMGDALPDHEPTFTAADLADSPAPESITEIAILGTLDTSSFEFNGAPPLNGAAAVEDSQFFEGEEPKVTDVSPVSIIGAKGLDGRVLNGTSDQEVVTAAICGVNSLQSSRYTQACSIVVQWPNGQSGACSSWIAGSRYLGTAGHCLYNKDKGGFVRSARVYCNANAGCRGPMTTTAASFAVSSNWLNNANSGFSNPWDGGVIKTRTALPYGPLPFGVNIGNYRHNVMVAGYPGQERSITNSPCQDFPEYTGCTQFTTFGSVSGQLNSGYFTPDIDTCKGHSGSSMYDREVGWVTGILSGASYSPCRNFAVALRVSGVDSGCNHPDGGVGISCLAAVAERLG